MREENCKQLPVTKTTNQNKAELMLFDEFKTSVHTFALLKSQKELTVSCWACVSLHSNIFKKHSDPLLYKNKTCSICCVCFCLLPIRPN